ncbi:MAG TPA: hypothetical protein VFV33_16240, partial [Gemmatimonadaceae bacterium]|nr:hypothetical protein [Gemmatimonadaceae bacterium]
MNATRPLDRAARRLGRLTITSLVLIGALAAAAPALAGLREARTALDAGQFDAAMKEYEAIASQG